MRLLLIRHGQTPANVLGLLDTAHPGPGLTALGERQANAVAEALRGEEIDGVFATTLVRTQLTALPFATATVIDGLHEIEAGDLEGRGDRASARTYLETAFAWGSGHLDVTMPGATDGHAFFERFDRGISVAAEVDTAAVFSHGAAIRVWTAARARNVPPIFAGSHELENTGVVELEGSPADGWTLISWAGAPVGGPSLVDDSAGDPTGDALDRA
ncbi:histidine phosphatase family protein [Glaciihabitans sp. GrIS 2.15]|uniref:histidine phosphatase family protein n=1 Tax=Glaciihabitans sp. GrIS 2.15 TaxID=3071710 RepID=UPI0019CA7F0A|nr:histidine phosphatase family protein [Salinibacterium sp.]MEC5169815.1 broad specificity phosphatase PhoE [Glaciihabitans sp. GrIS 2.15]